MYCVGKEVLWIVVLPFVFLFQIIANTNNLDKENTSYEEITKQFPIRVLHEAIKMSKTQTNTNKTKQKKIERKKNLKLRRGCTYGGNNRVSVCQVASSGRSSTVAMYNVLCTLAQFFLSLSLFLSFRPSFSLYLSNSVGH